MHGTERRCERSAAAGPWSRRTPSSPLGRPPGRTGGGSAAASARAVATSPPEQKAGLPIRISYSCTTRNCRAKVQVRLSTILLVTPRRQTGYPGCRLHLTNARAARVASLGENFEAVPTEVDLSKLC